MAQAANVTGLLVAWGNGEEAARVAALDAVYAELRRLARGHLRRERAGHSLPPTALVHEAYVKLIDQTRVRWRSRAHFFAIAAQAMRRILVDHARTRAASKRGGGCTVPLVDDVPAPQPAPALDVLALDLALQRLAAIDPRQSRLVELRFFGGLTVEETADALGVAAITVKRDWALARAWLYRELQIGPQTPTPTADARRSPRAARPVPCAAWGAERPTGSTTGAPVTPPHLTTARATTTRVTTAAAALAPIALERSHAEPLDPRSGSIAIHSSPAHAHLHTQDEGTSSAREGRATGDREHPPDRERRLAYERQRDSAAEARP